MGGNCTQRSDAIHPLVFIIVLTAEWLTLVSKRGCVVRYVLQSEVNGARHGPSR